MYCSLFCYRRLHSSRLMRLCGASKSRLFCVRFISHVTQPYSSLTSIPTVSINGGPNLMAQFATTFALTLCTSICESDLTKPSAHQVATFSRNPLRIFVMYININMPVALSVSGLCHFPYPEDDSRDMQDVGLQPRTTATTMTIGQHDDNDNNNVTIMPTPTTTTTQQ